eukprot:gene2831-17779_t
MWANVLKADAPLPTLDDKDDTGNEKERILVVDANAIISGIPLDRVGDRFFTIADVLHEIRDKKSRTYLSTLPYGIQTQEPTEDSVNRVLRFARETGDIHALSAADIKLLALSYQLEVQLYGGSRIATSAQPLDGLSTPGMTGFEAAAAAAAGTLAAPVPSSSLPGSTAPAGGPEGPGGAEPPQDEQDWSDEDDDEDDDDGWNTTGKSRNAVRRRDRNQRKWEEREAVRAVTAAEAEAEVAAAVVAKDVAGVAKDEAGVAKDEAVLAKEVDGEIGEESSEDSEDSEEDSEEEEYDGEDADEIQMVKFEEGAAEGAADGAEGKQGAEEEGEAAEEEVLMMNTTSRVSMLTADFPMQNVLLQMGLRLVAKDGSQITRLSRWALRCTACMFATKQAGRMFCPRCGNMTMERVEVTVGADGAEYLGVRKKHVLRGTSMTMERVGVTVGADGAEYLGVRKKHVLRGTRYSLPKPKRGGRGAGPEPILREDMMMLKMKKKLRRAKAKEAAIAAGDIDGLNPFAPEFGQDTWFQGQVHAGNKPRNNDRLEIDGLNPFAPGVWPEHLVPGSGSRWKY